ncbi:MAG: hypothetical protein V3T31_06715, partial [candidate division Zixibacteria bacterium]
VNEAALGDPNFVVATVSEDDGTFNAPPGVEPYVDKTEDVEETQRGLALIYLDLQTGDTGIASRELISTESYSGYKTLEMYVHGDESLTTTGTDSLGFFFRLGRDSANFYEYRVDKLYPDWVPNNYVVIDFQEITNLKDSAQVGLQNVQTVDVERDHLRVLGNPNINEIKYLAMGVVNNGSDTAMSGTVWVDELRVTGVRRDVGTAGRISFNGNMADLFTYSFNYTGRDPYFRGLSTATRGGSRNNLGSGKTEQTLNYGLNFNLEKFLPRSWGAKLPFSFSYGKTTTLPLLRTSSDIMLPDHLREEEKTVSESRAFRISESFSKRGRNPLFSVLLNRQSMSFSYNRSTGSSVTRPYTLSERYTISTNYDAGIRTAPTLPVFFWTRSIPLLKKAADSRLGLWPTQWKFTGQMNRTLTISEDPDQKRVSSLRKGFAGGININYNLFKGFTTTFRYSTKRDLADPELIKLSLNPSKAKLGLETNYTQNFSANYAPTVLPFVTTKMSYSADYSDSWQQTNETRRSTMRSGWGINGQFQHITLLSMTLPSSARPASSGRRGAASSKPANVKNRPFYDYPFALLRFLTGWINPISYKYNKSLSNSLPGMLERPPFKYRMGFQDDPMVSTIVGSQNPVSQEGVNYDFSSGFGILGGIRTDVNFRRSIKSDVVSSSTRHESRSTRWPDLGIRITKFTSFPLIKGVVNKFIAVFQPRTGYNRDVKEDFNLDNGFKTNEQTTISYNPLLSLNFKIIRGLSLSGTYTKSSTSGKKFNSVDGSISSHTISFKNGLAVATKYQFSAPSGFSIPLLGKIKFESKVGIDLSVRYTHTKSQTSTRGGEFSVMADKSDMTISPVISYIFSSQLKGGVSGRWQDTTDLILDRKSHVRQLQIWLEIRF